MPTSERPPDGGSAPKPPETTSAPSASLREPPDSERRRSVRHVACFPTFIERSESEKADKKAAAMITDLSESGIRLLVRNPDWKVGDELRLELHLQLELNMNEARIAPGKVVRVEELPDDRRALWTHEAAVELVPPITLTTAERDAVARRSSTPK